MEALGLILMVILLYLYYMRDHQENAFYDFDDDWLDDDDDDNDWWDDDPDDENGYDDGYFDDW